MSSQATSYSPPVTRSDEVLVRVEGVSKKFCRSLKRSLWYGVCDIAGELNPFAKHGARGMEHGGDSAEGRSVSPATSYLPPVTLDGLRPGEFWAVNDVSFELRRGECLGLIGHNGAGKTTLLKMLNGLIKPDRGRIEMNGRVGALIALGAGFNPVLTGRENIYINGSVLGLSKKEINEKIEEIIDFAEIREFIDMPVQNYSSGMQVRLGFAVATTLDPDVLILDEVLAVGDIRFRQKCYNRINNLIRSSAVIFVSHSMDHVATMCTSVAMLRRGAVNYYGDPVKGIEAYNEIGVSDEYLAVGASSASVIFPPVRSATVRMPERATQHGETLRVEVEVDCIESVQNLTLSFVANDAQERPVMSWSLGRSELNLHLPKGRSITHFDISPLLLHPGRYFCNLWIGRKGSIEALVHAQRAAYFTVVWPWKPFAGIPYQPLVRHVNVERKE
jgi:lipopolysaccharide transport system ATP-binding protein